MIVIVMVKIADITNSPTLYVNLLNENGSEGIDSEGKTNTFIRTAPITIKSQMKFDSDLSSFILSLFQ